MSFQDLFEKLGLTGGRWPWRAARWDRKIAQLRDRLRGEGRRVAYQHKFCPKCRAIVDRDDNECYCCGAKVGSWHAQAAGRAIDSIIPSSMSITKLLILINSCIFAAGILVAGFSGFMAPPESFTLSMSMIAPAFAAGQYWRIITYGYLHFGWMHILFNMFALHYAGMILEDEIGRDRFFAVYTAGMIGGGVLNLLTAVGLQFLAGASGAVFALIGFGAAYGHFTGGPRGEAIRTFFVRWVIYALLFTFMVPRVSISAHLGGLLTGALLGYMIANEGANRRRMDTVWQRISRTFSILTILAFVWMMAVILFG